MKPLQRLPSQPRSDVDFASAAMLRLLAQGMRELGLNPEPVAPPPAGHGATVPLDDKRRLVAAALAQGGIGCLALLGRGLHRLAHEPTHRALASARDVPDLLARWGRLERYIHSRHRVDVLSLADGRAQLMHRARPGCPPPLPAEDLVVLGVLLALLEALGAADVTAHIGPVPAYPQPDEAALDTAARQQRTAAWSIAWSPGLAARRPLHAAAAPGPHLVTPPAWPEPARRSFALLGADLMNPLTLPALAQAQGQAPRSLQRQLGRAGLGYTQLLASARCSAAAWWLLGTPTAIAEVGFLCGYADQPHFTRDFRQRVGLTPLRYREAFSAVP